MTIEQKTGDTSKAVALKSHKKRRTTADIGETVSIPGAAVGITVADLFPFGEQVQVSWLEPVDEPDKGVINTFTVRSNRMDYDDSSLIEIPAYAVAPTVWEPVESSESIVYWLE